MWRRAALLGKALESGDGGVPSTQRLLAVVARRWAKNGVARSGHAAQDEVGLSLNGSPGARALGPPVWESWGGRFQTAFHRREGVKYTAARARRLWDHTGVGLVERDRVENVLWPHFSWEENPQEI